MKLITEPYLTQLARWPRQGRHILAHFDTDTICVYQAYRPEIGHFAASHGFFGGPFQLTRMSWIKPNFLWMMYRSGWGTKSGQEVTLAVKIKRAGFDEILAQAVHSSFVPEIYGTHQNWRTRLASAPVRLQWDPDHTPLGHKEARRAIQLGLSGRVLAQYAHDWIVSIEDISVFVAAQREVVNAHDYARLMTPSETVYYVPDTSVRENLGITGPDL